MPTNKPFSLSGMIDTDAEEEATMATALPSPDSNQENVGRAKRKPGKTKPHAKKFTRQKRSSGDSVDLKPEGPSKAKPRKGKAPLKEHAGNAALDMNETDEFAHSDGASIAQKARAAHVGTKRKATDKESGRPAKIQATKSIRVEKDGEFEYTPTIARSKQHRRDVIDEPVKSHMQATSSAAEIPETQASDAIKESTADIRDEDIKDDVPRLRRIGQARNGMTNRQPVSATHAIVNTCDIDGSSGEAGLRRKLGDMKRKLESLESKYKDLKEIGVKEAELNYDRLKKQSENNAKAASELIDSLKKEIITHKAISQESASFQAQMDIRAAELKKAQSLADDLSRSLAEAQNENKVLQAKLNTSRSASVPRDKAATSGTSTAAQQLSRSQIGGSTEMAQAVQTAQLKEDLYSDLTGLILRSVDVTNDTYTYDCIQTGRNGTLHFKVGVAKESDNNYEDTEFQYDPRLDSDRDRDLIALLPEYLTEEITFSRTNAANFYQRVLETLTKRRVMGPDG